MILGIEWNMTSQLIDGWSTPNLYGLLFVTGLIIGFYVIKRMFKDEGIPEAWLDKLLIYVVIATIVGARLGHVFFYDWHIYKENPIDILKVWEGGLASHGGAIAILIALFIYSKVVTKKSMWWILDRIVAPIAIAGCFIRLGNLVNHEIIGQPTDLPWGFMFMHESINNLVEVDGEMVHVYRHPAQLYEAIGYLFSFIILLSLYWKTKIKEKSGFLFGLFLIFIFGWRFIVEFVKVGQAERDAGLIINTGQWLSVPFVIAGIVIVLLAMGKKLNPKKE
ncbi:prolipoprotein diacylglyceryl transferase [Brumimicrobium salinarum]|uniref:Phosphatidylglycerol--prolipoprotein diacylglyceryl transferase n=1 Tax=Brumimicrobium salinarum TaxID=2058658 RepID=A0A2I0R495_9FLAO|nr:prolipoprotein diacylglyceryl transferase [Brumimicrobium salinarum]PKR81404.1 prolipoprotein diacylglyceryl transferase [Brumimicrobium salinarum]